jgi:hypothetical protein
VNKKKKLVLKKHRKARLRLKAKQLELLKNKKPSSEKAKALKTPSKKEVPKKKTTKKKKKKSSS